MGEEAGGFAQSTTVVFVCAVQGTAAIILLVTGRVTYSSFGWRIFKLFGTDKQVGVKRTLTLNPNPNPNPNPSPSPSPSPSPKP